MLCYIIVYKNTILFCMCIHLYAGLFSLQVVDYISKHWHDILTEWADGLRSEMITLLTSTKNLVETTNQK